MCLVALTIAAWATFASAADGAFFGEVTRQLESAASSPAIAIDSEGAVLVAWSQLRGTDKTGLYPTIVVARLVDDHLQVLGPEAEAGGANGTRGEAWSPSLAFFQAGEPVVAWDDRSSGNHEIYLRRWKLGQWEDGPWSTGSGVSGSRLRLSVFPSVAVDAHGLVNLAWEEHQGSRSDIFVRQLPSGVEGGLTGFPAKLSCASQPSLTLDEHGAPTVAFVDDRTGGSQVFVGRLAPNGHWLEEALESTGASSASVRLDAKHRTVVSWKEEGSVRVARWNGARWQRLGDNVALPGSQIAWPSLGLVNSSQPLVAFRSGSSIQLRQWAAQLLHLACDLVLLRKDE